LSEVVVFDSGALGALADDDPRIRALLRRIVEEHAVVCVPVVVLAECYGDQRYDVRYDRALDALGGFTSVVDLTARTAIDTGRLRNAAGLPGTETIEAIVVATAASYPRASIVTANVRHVRPLAACSERSLGLIDLNRLPVR